MTGIERLRELANGANCSVWACTDTVYCKAHDLMGCNDGGRMRDALNDMADQIERELRNERDRWDRELCEAQMDKTRVMSVYLEMKKHVLGIEGMEDSPVARWASKLGEALRGGGRNHAADVSMSAYDLLPEDEREAIEWVRYHGGRDEVRMELDNLRGAIKETCARLGVERSGDLTADAQGIWRAIDRLKSLLGDSVPRAACERRLAHRQRQIDESHAALRRRNARIAELERERDELRAKVADMRQRLMPEGMEWLVEAWPRFEDGEPVRLGDEISWRDDGGVVNSIELQNGGYFILHAADGADDWIHPQYFPGERVKRPAPKVLDADGVEVEVGDDLYSVEGMIKFHVSAIDRKNSRIATEAMFALDKWADPKMYTHRAPVLAADGKPLREGETVWSTDSGTRYTVEKVTDELIPIKCCSEMGSTVSLHPSQLTHERPDSWERLEEDAAKNPFDYCRDVGHRLDTCENAEAYKAHDLVRRARALAGGE